jgi:hypothetical protein
MIFKGMMRPPKSTSRTQPLDMVIFVSFKVNYSKLLVKYIRGNKKSVSIARMVPWIKGAVTDVNQDTIAKLF